MAFQSVGEFSRRLMELNEWQIEQEKKLKIFQETQKKLVEIGCKPMCSAFNVPKGNTISGNHFNLNEKNTHKICNEKAKSEPDTEHYEYNRAGNLPVKLNDDCCLRKSNAQFHQKKFLKRGDGLARFRMTLDDFKTPPQIYKERRIKTYLDRKPVSVHSNISNPKQPKFQKNSKGKLSNSVMTQVANISTIPVNIYIPESKLGKSKGPLNFGLKQNDNIVPKMEHNIKTSKNLYEGKMLNPFKIESKKFRNDSKEQLAHTSECNVATVKGVESEKKRNDDHELKVFEILEQKVNDSSFCSTSSLIDKLLEQTSAMTDLKNCKKSLNSEFHSCSLRSGGNATQLNSGDEKIKCNNQKLAFPIDALGSKSEIKKANVSISDVEEELCSLKKKTWDSNENFEPESIAPVTNLKSNFVDNFDEISMKKNQDPKYIDEPQHQPTINQNEIAVTLKRKGLQDNVKQLMNWEHSPRKKSCKRVTRKPKLKPKRNEKTTKEQSEKVTFTSTLLRNRLEELEKEIAVFRKENGKIERLQKELHEERIKLGKERKEFEKQMQEEKDKLEKQMTEGRKKLQKERNVFETYCKQAGQRPTRQEREEISQLKKENEKLSESVATKEARWGASQARLRNQIRNLEKENAQLKAENEKLKKLAAKKVTFGNDRSLNSKIMRAINFELVKLRSSVTTNGKSCSCRSQTPKERTLNVAEGKPIRRIRSTPNVGESNPAAICDDGEGVSIETESKFLASTSTDSGNKYVSSGRSCNFETLETVGVTWRNDDDEDKVSAESGPWEGGSENGCFSELESGYHFEDDYKKAKHPALGLDRCDDCTQKVVGESVFPIDSSKGSHSSDLDNSRETKQPVNSARSSTSQDCRETWLNSRGESKGKEASKIMREIEVESKSKLSMSYYHDSSLKGKNLEERVLQNGTKEIVYPNGNIKRVSSDGKIIKIIYYNGDIKEKNNENGSEKYFYAETDTWHTTYKDGMEVIEFPSGQTERRYADGSSEISFPNGCVRYCDPSGKDEWRFADGTVIKTNELGHKILLMANGQKEIHTKEFKKREYPDGTVKIVYTNGTQETRYPSGRVRLKDKNGHLVMDSGGL
ncbi:hypothetical protein RUM44_013915 [Polyplax serrata]|uniref:Centromere protein J C-terminal domain-containing protein n=1 Tax=Polyplax serrata TaxID=468196 RepID=A0ABR1BJK7_POLSC